MDLIVIDGPNLYNVIGLVLVSNPPDLVKEYMRDWFDMDRLILATLGDGRHPKLGVVIFHSRKALGTGAYRLDTTDTDRFWARQGGNENTSVHLVDIPGDQHETFVGECSHCHSQVQTTTTSEKGIDTSITTYLLQTAPQWQSVCIVARDVDYVPPVTALRRMGKQVFVASTTPNKATALVRVCQSFWPLDTQFLADDWATFCFARRDGVLNLSRADGDFPTWFAEGRPVPRKTVFIKGNHEDFVWLDERRSPEVLPGLFYLRNGSAMDLGKGRDALRVGGVGGCYGPADFERPAKNLHGYAKRHYTRDEIDVLRGRGKIDILLVHDAPAGVRFERHRHGAGWVSDAIGLDQLVASVRPKVCFFGHHHTRVDGEIAGVRCIGLNKVMMPGNLVAIDLEPRGGAWSILGEWPNRPRNPGFLA